MMTSPNVPERERSAPLPEGRIKDLAECRLQRHPYLALKRLSCDFRNGTLLLSGCVPSYFLKQVAQTAVADVEGVKWIDNQITVLAPNVRS